MDGLDGLVGGSMLTAISFITYGLIYKVSLDTSTSLFILLGALTSFCCWNWSPAKIFMGDIGSTFLGAIFGGLILLNNSWSEALSMVMIASPLFLDPIFCIFKRLIKQENIFKPHRDHLYQKLALAGIQKNLISTGYILSTFLLGIGYLVGLNTQIIILVMEVLVFLKLLNYISFKTL